MTMRWNTADRSRGFTLIEVLAALVIVALGMLGVIEAVTQSARNGTYLREKTLAHWIAMNLITERRLQVDPPQIGETSDEVQYAGERWHWRLRVTKTQVDTIRRMEASVRAASAAESSSLANVSGFYGSTVGGNGAAMNWSGTGGTGGQGGSGQKAAGQTTGAAAPAPVTPPSQTAPRKGTDD